MKHFYRRCAAFFLLAGILSLNTTAQEVTGHAEYDIPGLTSISSFGETILEFDELLCVGTTGHREENISIGAVNILEQGDAGYDVVQLLTISEPVSAGKFGSAMARSDDFLMVAAEGFFASGVSREGQVGVFQLQGGTFQEIQKLSSTLDTSHGFGTALATNDNWLAIGSPKEIEDGKTGYVYVYTKNGDGTGYTYHSKFADNIGEEEDDFGTALIFDGDNLIVGIPQERFDLDGMNPVDNGGAVQIFSFNETTNSWTPTQRLLDPNRFVLDKFGLSLDVEDGWLAVGSNQTADFASPNQGEIDLFAKQNGLWVVNSALTSGDPYPTTFMSQNIKLNGNFLWISSSFGEKIVNGNRQRVGRAEYFELTDGVWETTGNVYYPPGIFLGDQFGRSLAIGSDRIYIGAARDGVTTQDGGSLHVLTSCLTQTTVQEQSSCSPIEFNGEMLTASGFYDQVLQSAAGCDSIVRIDFTLNTADNTTDEQTVCFGENYSFGTQTLTTSGDYTEVFANANGCDSTVVLTLTVSPQVTGADAATICNGASYTFGTQTLTDSGDYTETFAATNGCDSLVTLTLTVSDPITGTDAQTICAGAGYTFGTQTLTASGDYTETFQAANGCDSLVTLTLTVSDQITGTDTQTVCAGESYTFGTQTLTASGDYDETFMAANGCDSLVTLSLTVLDELASTDQQSACNGTTYTFGTQELNMAGEYTEVFQSAAGCDSTVTLTLDFIDSFMETDAQSVCNGATYTFGTQELTASGEYMETFQSSAGCDSTVTLTLTVLDAITGTANETICAGDTYDFNGDMLSTAGEYMSTYTSAAGCDSLVTLTLAVTTIDNGITNNDEQGLAAAANAGATYQWVDCNDNNSPIDGATDATYLPLLNGSYAAIITLDGCEATTDCGDFDNNIAELVGLSGKIYPNPARDQIVLELSGTGVVNYQIVDVFGKIVLTGQNNTAKSIIDISELANGTYSLRAIQEGQLISKTILKL